MDSLIFMYGMFTFKLDVYVLTSWKRKFSSFLHKINDYCLVIIVHCIRKELTN